jgi:sulfate adenylyltransferase subunit 2
LSTHLKRLESESIAIMREVAAEFANPVMLYSIGKDSGVMLHLAVKAFYPSKPPFPLLHVDTGWKFRDMIRHRDSITQRYGVKLLVYTNPEGLARGIDPITSGSQLHTQVMKTEALKQALDKWGFDAVFGGARRDEEKARAKERVFSLRDEFGQWEPRSQRPELWSLYNGRLHEGEHMRIFPISNWTELDIWDYIGREGIEIPSIYYSHQRRVFQRDGMWLAESPWVTLADGEEVEERSVRFRTVGDATCTGAVESVAADVASIIEETAVTRITERGATRADDRISEAGMEDRKRDGYF